MPHKKGAYERRGNNTARIVREKAGANKPITRREMRAAFEAWKAGRGINNAEGLAANKSARGHKSRLNSKKDSDKTARRDTL